MKQNKPARPVDLLATAAAPAPEPEKFTPSPELQEAIAAPAPEPVKRKPDPELLTILRQAVNDLHYYDIITTAEAQSIKNRMEG